MASVRIVIADDHRILRDGLRHLLEAEPGYEVVGEAGTVEQALRLVRELAPDVLILDLALPDGSGIDVLRGLDASGADTRVIVLTASAEREQVVEALLLGARAVVLKESATVHLFDCLRAVAAGEYWLRHDRIGDVIGALQMYSAPPRPTPAESLTTRELDIVAAVVGGASNREIARQLAISEQTVKNHMSSVFDKVGVSNRLELALYATHHKLLDRRRSPAPPAPAQRSSTGPDAPAAAAPPSPDDCTRGDG